MPTKKNRITVSSSNGDNENFEGSEGKDRKVEHADPDYRRADEKTLVRVVKREMGNGRSPLDDLPPMKYANKKWYVYDSELGYFKYHEENYVHSLIQQQTGDVPYRIIADLGARHRCAVHYLGHFHPAIRADGEDTLINVLNGLTRVKYDGKHSLEKHDSKWCFSGVLPVEYDLDAKCPIFKRELNVKLPDPLDQKVILLFGAYCLVPDCRLGVTLFNYGPSHTGKSTIIVNGLGSVFGELMSSLKLSEICPENYSGISHVPVLADKLLNIGSEVDGREVKDTTNFKRLISGESVMARSAFERGGEFCPSCKLAFNMNELPKINATEAEGCRIRIIWFNRVTKQSDRNFKIEKQIRREGSGIFMELLNQLPELFTIQEFPYGSDNSQWIYKQLQEKIDPFNHFVKSFEDKLELGFDKWIASNKLEPYLIRFLKDNDYETIYTLEKFRRRLYARFNFRISVKWLPEGVHRNCQKEYKVVQGIGERKLN